MSYIYCLHCFFSKFQRTYLKLKNWLMVGIWKQCSPFAAKLIGLKQQLLSWPGIAVFCYKLLHLLLLFCFIIFFILFSIFTSCLRLPHIFLPTYLFYFRIAWFVENTFFLFFYQLVLSSPPRLVDNKFLFPSFSNILLHERCSCYSEL